MKIMLNDTRLAFPSLWTPSVPKGGQGKPAFSGSFLIPPTHKQLAQLRKAMRQVAAEKWGAKADAVYKALETTDKLCLHNGDAKTEYDGFEGMLFVSARSQVRPLVIDQAKNPLTESDGKPYSGCYVNANLELWAQDNQFGKRINAQLRGVQFLRDGDAFSGGGRPADPDEFEDISADEGDTDPLTE